MVDFVSKPSYGIKDLENILVLLRSPEGCPWDREQTHKTIKRNMLEEAYEAAEAIEDENTENLLEELGDVLMQVVFHAQIAKEAGNFSLDDIADATCKKLIRRHPHVFGNVKAENGNESLVVWDDIKREEKHHETTTDAMHSVARSLPALWRAEKIQKKAAKTGFDWPDFTGALEALNAELVELNDAISANSAATGKTSGNISEELGDLLFSVVNVARFFDIDPEEALTAASNKFIQRFSYIESNANRQGKSLKDMSFDEMETLYQQGKLEK